MRLIVVLNHPAHYYVFKYSVIKLINSGIEVKYVIRDKDILENLLISENVDYIKINEKRKRKQSIFSVISNGIFEIIKQDINLFKLCLKWRPNLMIGTDFAIAHIGKLLRIPSFVFNEDDYEINKLFCKLSYPFATKIVAPNSCSVGKYQFKKISYNGFQKMAYLHRDYFKPDFNLISKHVSPNEKYFIIRLVSLTSGHDIEGKHTGLTEDIVLDLISILEKHGRVFINNEGPINPKFEKYKLNIKPNLMHHFLYYSQLLIGDSQTMCAEAGLLGTPFIRFNDFVGKIEYLNEIENNYKLGFGIPTNQPEKLIEKTKDILSQENTKEIWETKKNIIFDEKIDVAQFYYELLTNQLTHQNKK